MYLCVWNLVIYIVLCQGENLSVLVLDIDEQNTMHVFASKGIHAMCLNLNL